MDIQYTKELLAEYIAERVWDIAERGRISREELIDIDDIGGQGCEVSVRLRGDCWETPEVDLPPTLNIDIWYDGDAEFYKKGTGKTIYSIPVMGRIIDSK